MRLSSQIVLWIDGTCKVDEYGYCSVFMCGKLWPQSEVVTRSKKQNTSPAVHHHIVSDATNSGRDILPSSVFTLVVYISHYGYVQ